MTHTDLLEKLEPGARSDGNEPVQTALESIAISLKRIADELESGTGNTGLTEVLQLLVHRI